MGAVHGTRCRSLEINAFAVVPTPVTGALELVFTGFPVGRTAQMRAPRENDKQAIRGAIHPNAVFLLPLRIYAQRVVRGIANLEDRGRFKQRARQEKTQEGEEPRGEKTCDAAPNQATAMFIDFTRFWADG